MSKVLIGSTNPVKVRSVKEAFESMFPEESFNFEGFKALSGVADQPMTDEETKRGAQGRVDDMKNKGMQADYYVAIEGGIDTRKDQTFTYGAIVVESKDGLTGRSTTAEVQIPPASMDLVQGGMELAHANDKIFGSENSKHSSGMTGLLTDNLVDRTAFYKQAIILALVPFKHRNLYEKSS